MTERSARFDLPLLQPGQAQKEIYHNEALTAVDALLHPAVEGGAVSTPPAAPEPGQSWIVGAGATGDWVGQEDRIATWTAGGWRFLAPQPGTRAWDKNADLWVHWNGFAWSDALPAARLVVDGQQVVGERQPTVASPSGGTTIDSEARAAVASIIVALKSHGLID